MRTHPFRPALAALALVAAQASAQGTTTAVGMVLDNEGNPVGDVQVLMSYKGHVVQKYKTKTDKKGKFVHVNVYAGLYDITMKKEGLGEVTFKDFTFRDLGATEKPPVFRLGVKKEVAPPGEGAPGQGDAAAAAAALAAQQAGLLAGDLEAADAAMRSGRVDEAMAGYEKVARAAPNLAEVHHNLGLALAKKGEKVRAEAEFRKATELKPGLADAHRALSVLLYEAGEREEALSEAAKAAEADPRNATLLYNLGVMHANAGQGAEARAALLRAEEIDPDSAEVQFQLGTVAVAANDKAEAISRLERYLALAPGGPNAASARAMVAALKK
jgi:Flp pilus assembly protein TadD